MSAVGKGTRYGAKASIFSKIPSNKGFMSNFVESPEKLRTAENTSRPNK